MAKIEDAGESKGLSREIDVLHVESCRRPIQTPSPQPTATRSRPFAASVVWISISVTDVTVEKPRLTQGDGASDPTSELPFVPS